MEDERKKYWHKIVENCPSCNEKLALISVSFAADGRFLFDWYCMKEQKEVHTQYLHVDCICKAFEADLEQSFFATEVA